MANEFNCWEDANFTTSPAQVELLEALLEPDDAPYPWNTADPESEVYFVEAEQDFVVEDWLEQEIAARSPNFFSQLNQLWSATTPTAYLGGDTDVSTLQARLRSGAACIPQGWLNVIADKAHQIFSMELSMADQLVQCVQTVLPNWTEDDLLVLARPFAYAMRGDQRADVEFVLGEVRSEEWTALSEIEQARMSLAIARYVLDQLQSAQRRETPSPS